MPTYDYHCNQCGYTAEVTQKITDDPLKLCPKCGHETLRRGPGGGIGLLFKGTGFYKTDYASPKPPQSESDSSSNSGGCCPCGKNKNSCGG